MTASLRRGALALRLLAAVTILGFAAPAGAQQNLPPQKEYYIGDGEVELFRGSFLYTNTDISIGGEEGGLRFTRHTGVREYGSTGPASGHNLEVMVYRDRSQTVGTEGPGYKDYDYYVVNGRGVEQFYQTWQDTTIHRDGTLATLTSSGENGPYVYTGTDGTVINFAALSTCPGLFKTYSCAVATSLVRPNGATTSFAYDVANGVTRLRLASTNHGYAIGLEYDSAGKVSRACAVNLALFHASAAAPCPAGAPSASYTYGADPVTYVNWSTFTDAAGQTTNYTYAGNSGIATIKGPGSQVNDLVVAYHGITGRVASQTYANGAAWTYTYQQTEHPYTSETTSNAWTDVTSPLGHTVRHASGQPRPGVVTDALGRTSTWQWVIDSPRPLLDRKAEPEGNYVQYSYDARDNVTVTRAVAKPGSGGLADIVTSALYPETCSNQIICNKPISTTDARNGVTEYDHSPVHGGPVTVTGPAVPTRQANGTMADVRPQTRYAYEQRYAGVKDAGGSLVQAATPVWVLTEEKKCMTTASCAGGADEVKIVYDYGPSGAGPLLLRGKVVIADGQSLRTCYGYDARGNRISETSPRANLASCSGTPPTSDLPFASAVRYDAMRRVVGTIAPDPDGAGTLRHAAVRNSYDGAGQLTKVEKGELSDWQSEAVAPASWTGFTIFQTVDFAYDAAGRKEKQTLSGGGTVHSVTEYIHDADNRLVCTRTRMHPTAFGTRPNLCELGTEGSSGPDRVITNVYDAANQLVQVREGVGTSIEAAEATYSYSSNGKRRFVIDGRGNRAELRYDGHDRQVRWVFPSTTAPTAFDDTSQATALASSGALNEGDFESYEYDAAGNRTKLRKRDTSELTYSYDAANRMSVKIVPERSGLTASQTRDVYFTYDLRNLQRTAGFDSLDGAGISNTYDGFGRLASSVTSMDGSTLTNNYQYDPDGNRTQLSTSAGYLLNFISDGLGRLIRVEEGGPNIVAQFGYDAAGRRLSLAMGTGGSFSSSVSYGYDPAGRLAGLGTELAGTASDRTLAFGYNPASQMIAQTSDNASYAWTGAVNVNRDYTTNGLNQYSVAGPAAFTYDANGNLITDGSTAYVYDVENRLVSASGAKNANLAYDPLGRLWQTSGGSAGITRFFYDGDRLIEEHDGAGNRLRVYAHGTVTDRPLVWYELTGGTSRRYLHVDHQGSIVALAGETGNLVAINSYDEYGIPAPTNLGRFAYTGQTWIAELGMYYYKARIYSPTLGRFLQTDPVGYKDQINLYAYVGNDPVNLVDPTGKCKSISDEDKRADCLDERATAIEGAKAYLADQSVERGKEPAYIATYNEDTGEITVRTGDEAGNRTGTEVGFTDKEGNDLRAQPDGRIIAVGDDGTKTRTNEIVLVTGHGHTKDVGGGGSGLRNIDRANENPMRSSEDPILSRIAPAVVKTPSGKIMVFVNEKEVR